MRNPQTKRVARILQSGNRKSGKWNTAENVTETRLNPNFEARGSQNWNKRSNMTYKILEHDKAKKFKRNTKDKQLILRIEKKYIEIIKNPYKPSFFGNEKVTNVQNVEEQELEITE